MFGQTSPKMAAEGMTAVESQKSRLNAQKIQFKGKIWHHAFSAGTAAAV